MKSAADAARRAASSRSTVLLLGETGTGKRRLAEQIHYASPQSAGSFVTWNTAETPNELLASRLFGHRRGAFTGATETIEGLLVAADLGTFFIDDADQMSMEAQRLLLRFLDDGEILPVGDMQPRTPRVRLVVASKVNLRTLAQKDQFLPDLANRLSGITIQIPPIRKRPEDIEAFAGYFVAAYTREFGKTLPVIEPETFAFLKSLSWHGNIRELAMVIENVLFDLRSESLTPADVREVLYRTGIAAAEPRSASDVKDLPLAERRTPEMYKKVLTHTRQNKAAAARLLGVPRRTFTRDCKRFGLTDPPRAMIHEFAP